MFNLLGLENIYFLSLGIGLPISVLLLYKKFLKFHKFNYNTPSYNILIIVLLASTLLLSIVGLPLIFNKLIVKYTLHTELYNVFKREAIISHINPPIRTIDDYREAYALSKVKSESSLNIRRRSLEYDIAVTDTSTKGKAVAPRRSSLNSIRTNLQNPSLIDDRDSIDSQMLNRAKAMQNRKYDFGPQIEAEPDSAKNSTERATKSAIIANE